MILVAHHIAGDGWSLGPLLRDLGTAYAARCRGAEPQWEPLPVQYADYALWQREFLGDDTDAHSLSAAQIRYWREELAGAPDQLVLPFDRPRPAVASFAGDEVAFEVGGPLRRDLERLASAHGVTMPVLWQTALAITLHRLGAGDDIPLGSPIAGRLDESLHDLVGFFVNTWVLRVRIDAGMSFADLLERVQDRALAAYEHQDVPFERLVEELNPVRSTAHHPLFQVSLAFQNNETPTLDLPGVDVSMMTVPVRSSRFDLLLHVGGDAADAGFTCSLEFATDLFDRSTVRDIGRRLVGVLEQAVADPTTRADEFGILIEADQHRALEWSHGDVCAVPATRVDRMVAARAARHPEAIAVIHGERRLTYGQLLARAERLAGVLAAAGVGPESVVAVALSRSSELIVAWLAVLRVGGAYLPIDPNYPSDRITYILADARRQSR
ncbi:condensation domain-containing protein [Nocardia sp. MW-W600-9]